MIFTISDLIDVVHLLSLFFKFVNCHKDWWITWSCCNTMKVTSANLTWIRQCLCNGCDFTTSSLSKPLQSRAIKHFLAWESKARSSLLLPRLYGREQLITTIYLIQLQLCNLSTWCNESCSGLDLYLWTTDRIVALFNLKYIRSWYFRLGIRILNIYQNNTLMKGRIW